MAGKYNETAWNSAKRFGLMIEQFVWKLLAPGEVQRLALAPVVNRR